MSSDDNSKKARDTFKRPEWVEIINAHGCSLDIQSIVPLTVDNLIETAVANTGLSYFGTDDWCEPFAILVKSLEEEADLNLLGRIMTRGDLIRTLEGRLQIEAAYKQHPEIDQQIIGAPLIITGAARTGTSALYNLLAADPENRVPLLWEVWFPAPPPEKATYDTDPRIEKANKVAQIWDDIDPEWPLLHKQAGNLPVEDNYLLLLALRGPNAWLGKVPSYIQSPVNADLKPSLDYAKRILKYLQWKYQCKRWVLKSPAFMVPLTAMFEAFPDAMMVHTHRDPVKLTASSSHLLTSVFRLRTDNYQTHQHFYETITNNEALAGAMNANIDLMENGSIPKDQIVHVLYKDFIEDNIKTVKNIYAYFGIDAPESSFNAMQQYAEADAEARKKSPKYHYKMPSAEEVISLQKLYGRYQNYYGIPNEI